MSKQTIQTLIQTTLAALQQNGALLENIKNIPSIQIETTKDKKHGHFACNIALLLAKSLQRPPREIADLIVKSLPASPFIEKVEIAGAGFINFFLSPKALYQVILDIQRAGEKYGHSNAGQGKKILVEYVSSNPTGPLHVGHGRHAAYGAVVADLLAAIGYDVHREYYVNDAGRQMAILTVSAWLRYLEFSGEKIIFPANAYQGDYLIAVSRQLKEKYADEFLIPAEKIFSGLPLDVIDGGDKEIYIDALIAHAKLLLGEQKVNRIFEFTLDAILGDIRQDLAEFGVHYQTWFSERHFIQSDAVDRMMDVLRQQNLLYQQEGAWWFRATQFGDEKDRVMVRTNGERTYFTNDLAYHVNKFERGFDLAIDIFGSDHHGYVPRIQAGLEACGVAPERLTYLLVQFVMLYRNAQPVQMSTRSGSFVTLRQLRAEVGNDAARFFYVMRKCEQAMDFDLDLAKSQSNDNPVYYIQYAYARIGSVFRQLAAKETSFSYQEVHNLSELTCLTDPSEQQLIEDLGHYTEVIHKAATQYEPHLLTHYLREIAADFHRYYNTCAFLVPEDNIRHARLTLISVTRQILTNGLMLLGVSRPERM